MARKFKTTTLPPMRQSEIKLLVYGLNAFRMYSETQLMDALKNKIGGRYLRQAKSNIKRCEALKERINPLIKKQH